MEDNFTFTHEVIRKGINEFYLYDGEGGRLFPFGNGDLFIEDLDNVRDDEASVGYEPIKYNSLAEAQKALAMYGLSPYEG